MGYVNKFIEGYIECALWSSTDNTDDSGGKPLDENYDTDDLSDEALVQMHKDCLSFIWYNRAELRASKQSAEQSGHDFWLTRNRHGAGFWDRGLGAVGRKLTEASHAYGSVDLIVGDDGKVHS